MMINGTTIRMPRHELETLHELAERQLAKLTPGSRQHRQLENAFLSLTDALCATFNLKEY
jgi:hypothetical protein